jgi:osmotically-inducible protein OsmY
MAGTGDSEREAARQLNRMSWRAAGAQFYPGGAYDALHALSHRGRGPKGYRRSDERLKEIICDRLTEDPFIDASHLTIDVRNCEVTVQGAVQVRQQKYAIEDLIADVSGVTEIHNHVSVASQEIEERMSGL